MSAAYFCPILLVGAAGEIVLFQLHGVRPVQHHGHTAVRAIYQSREHILLIHICPAAFMGSYLLYDIPGFLIHQRFMSMLKDQPLGFGAFAPLFVLVGLGAIAEVDRVSKIDHVLKHIRHHVAGPVIRTLRIQP